jgi:hypothetical protein
MPEQDELPNNDARVSNNRPFLGTPWLRRNKVIPSNVEQVKDAAQLDATVGHILAVLEDGLPHGGESTR